MNFSDTPYFEKLLEKKRALLKEICRENNIHSILDFGAGNGTSFSKYIHQEYPNIKLTVFDQSKESLSQINWSDERVAISSEWDFIKNNKYDLIIASEVIEHQENPVMTMVQIRGCLSTDGKLLITIPNGYGFNELCSFLKKCIIGSGHKSKIVDVFTLADSPHLSFFSNNNFQSVISDSGFKIQKMGNVVFSHFKLVRYLCNKYQSILSANFFLSNVLPSWLCDDWYYVLEVGGVNSNNTYKKSRFSQFRARLNAKK